MNIELNRAIHNGYCVSNTVSSDFDWYQRARWRVPVTGYYKRGYALVSMDLLGFGLLSEYQRHDLTALVSRYQATFWRGKHLKPPPDIPNQYWLSQVSLEVAEDYASELWSIVKDMTRLPDLPP